MPNPDLLAKYGANAFDAGLKIQPKTFEQRLAERDSLDQHFTKFWLDFAITGLGRRSVLDTRTRLLVFIGQFTVAKSHADLEDAVRAALAAGVKSREILEIILQCVVYSGHTAVDPAIRIFHRIAEELGLLEELRASQLPLDGNDRRRSYDEERKTWSSDDLNDPRCADLMKRYGWLAVGRGLTMRPGHHLDILSLHDALDPEWAALWETFCYQGMYSRFLVDDKTRLLCMVGDCIAVHEVTQGQAHMRGALHHGASPREVMEVIFQSSINFGMPWMTEFLNMFIKIMGKAGRLAEIGNPAGTD